MKTAAALKLKTEYSSQISFIKTRITQNLLVEKGDENSMVDNPNDLMQSYRNLNKKIISLSSKITLHNATVTIKYPSYYDNSSIGDLIGDLFTNELPKEVKFRERFIVEALTERDTLKQEIAFYKTVVTSSKTTRYSQKDIKKVAALDIKLLQTKIDTMSKFLRILDGFVQEHNWSLEIDV